MTLRQSLKKNGFNNELSDLKSYKGVVDIDDFINNEGDTDETQFDVTSVITRSGIQELEELWIGFCKDEGYKLNSVINVTIVG